MNRNAILVHLKTVLLVGATVMAIHTCIRIEALSARSEIQLPVHQKIRVGPTTERVWRQVFLPRKPDGSVEDRELTTEEWAGMEAETETNRRRSALRGALETWGILQYPVVFGVLLSSLWILGLDPRTWRRLLAGACGTAAVVCGAILFMRGYLTSCGF